MFPFAKELWVKLKKGDDFLFSKSFAYEIKDSIIQFEF